MDKATAERALLKASGLREEWERSKPQVPYARIYHKPKREWWNLWRGRWYVVIYYREPFRFDEHEGTHSKKAALRIARQYLGPDPTIVWGS